MKIAIIGAGVAGLAALKNSLDEGHDCELFEQTGVVGGTWKYVERVGVDEFGLPIHTSMYEDLRTNLPKELMMFEGFPYKKGLIHSYISYKEVYEYIEAYAEHFQLSRHIKFFHHLEAVSPLPEERWLLKVRSLKDDAILMKDFDSIIICIGNNSSPMVPEISGKHTFRGKIIHSHDYRNPNPYKNKRVLVVGVGPSGVDIAAKILGIAHKVIQCRRTVINNELGFKIPDGVTIRPEIDEISETTVKFIDGSEDEIDDIILCTGFKLSLPFLTPECGLQVDNRFVRYLYKHTVNVEHPTMALIGLPKSVPLFPTFCLQVRFFLAFLKGNFTVNKAEMRQEVEKYIEGFVQSGKQPEANILKEYKEFSEELARLANITPMKPVIPKMYAFVVKEALAKFDISYKILNDEEFEHFRCDNIDFIRS